MPLDLSGATIVVVVGVSLVQLLTTMGLATRIFRGPASCVMHDPYGTYSCAHT